VTESPKLDALAQVFATLDSAVVAVSGGVDSMTLAHFAQRHFDDSVRMVHAVSPAVPAAATARVRSHADGHGWALSVIDAEEFADARYRANPINRCYFCKTNLYDRIAERFGGTILSGTNTDDLTDFRPGLKAAAERGVRHPYVEAGIAKAEVRSLARTLGLDDLAELPAAPCLSSRIETGIAIDAGDLALVEAVEERLRMALGSAELRCRVTARGVRLELDDGALAALGSAKGAAARDAVERTIAEAGKPFLGYAPYRRGSAFLRDGART
jgi:pyridinium-3,5-biscarboxylic acid mononucleotide sulfurtransferase